MSLGTSPNPLISSTTIGLETNKRKCIIADRGPLERLPKRAFMQVVTQSPEQLPLSWLWVPEKQLQRASMSSLATNKKTAGYL